MTEELTMCDRRSLAKQQLVPSPESPDRLPRVVHPQTAEGVAGQ